jgi:hypothetical protein
MPPSPPTSPPTTRLSPGELSLLQKESSAPILLIVRTATQADVGLWLRWRNLTLCLTKDKAVLLADGPRPFLQSVSYDLLRTTFYNHRSGELVLVPAPDLLIRSLAIPPDDGWTFLSKIQELSNKQPAHKDTLHVGTSH